MGVYFFRVHGVWSIFWSIFNKEIIANIAKRGPSNGPLKKHIPPYSNEEKHLRSRTANTFVLSQLCRAADL